MAIELAKRRSADGGSKRWSRNAACTLFILLVLAVSSTLLSRRSVNLYLPNGQFYSTPVFGIAHTIESQNNSTRATSTIPSEKQLFALSPPKSKFAYAYMMFLCDPTDPERRYRQYLSNVLVGAKILRDKVHSQADVVVLIKTKYTSNMTRLLPEDEEMLQKLNVRIVYLPFFPDVKNVLQMTMVKFYTWQLTEYRRVLFLDADVMPMANMDYLFDLSVQGVIEPHAIIAGILEPANAGFALLEPSERYFLQLEEYIANMPYWKDFDKVNGWGHRIEEPDLWETNMIGRLGTEWNFHGSAIDQGLLYHFPKYDLKHMTSILARKVENFGPDPTNSSKVIVVRRWDVKDIASSPFGNLSKPFWNIIPSNCRKFSGGAKCVPPYTDFHHFTGSTKPWKAEFSLDLWVGTQNPKTSLDVWWNQLLELQVEDGIDIMSLGLEFNGVDPRIANAASFRQTQP